MSDERWNPENQGKQFSDDSNIVDSTAEVVDEAGGTASGGYSNSYGADSDSAAGNGTYYSDYTAYPDSDIMVLLYRKQSRRRVRAKSEF